MSVKGIVGIAIVIVLGIGAVASYVSAANYGNATEEALDAKYTDNENVLSGGYSKVSNIAGVSQMATKQLKEIVEAAIGGRYGENGSQAVVQFVREQNPSLDPAINRKLVQVIESSQDEFKNGQTAMLEIKRSYKTSLGTVYQGTWLKIAGYPKKDLEKYRIISTDFAQDAFRTGKQGAMIPFNKD